MRHRKTFKGVIVSLFKAQAGKCFYCTREMFLIGDGNHPLFATVDHKIPASQGGTLSEGNSVAACAHCNEIKDDLTAEEFLVLLQEYGSIHIVTQALRGVYVAKKWRESADKPIPQQPEFPSVWPRPQKRMKTRKKYSGKECGRQLPAFAKLHGNEWKVRVYDLAKHAANEASADTEKNAKSLARSFASVSGQKNMGRYVAKIAAPNGEMSWLYHQFGFSWAWTPFAMEGRGA